MKSRNKSGPISKKPSRWEGEVAQTKNAQKPKPTTELSAEASRRLLNELQLQQALLETQNEELRQQQDELEASYARYFDFYNLAPVGYLTIGPQGCIKEVNLPVATMLGLGRETIVGQKLTRFIYPADQDCYYLYSKQLYATGMAGSCELRLLNRDGGANWVRLDATLVHEADGAALCRCVISDISERKQMSRYQQLSAEILNIVNNPIALPDAISRILSAIKREMEVDAVGIRLRSGDDFPYFKQQGFSADFLRTENSLLVRDADGGICRDENGNPDMECICGLVLTGRTDSKNPLFTVGGSAWTNDASVLLDIPADQDPRLNPRNRCIHEGYASIALVPIRANRHIIGVIQLNDRKKNRFTLGMIEIFEGISSSIGTAFLRKQDEETLRSSQARYRALVEQSSEAQALVDIETREVVEMNRRYTELFGYLLPDDAPLYANQIVATSQEKLDRLYNVTLRRQTYLQPEAMMFRHKNGSEVPVERAGTVICIDGRDYLLASIRDMTAERRRQAELVRDVDVARQVQRELLPEIPESPFVHIRALYYPSNLVSGDSYYLEWRNGGALLRGFLIDIFGHGLATALQTASINVLLRESCLGELQLLKQVRWINARAAKYFAEGTYAAMLGFEMDFALMELQYVGAGITQFYANGNKVLSPGMFVGMLADAKFETGSFSISEGDTFHFLTDGFTDALAMPETAEFWSLGGKDFDADVASLVKLAGSGTLRDDATGMCVKVKKLKPLPFRMSRC